MNKTKKYDFRFYMKSGNTFVVRAESLSTEYSSRDGELVSWKIDGIDPRSNMPIFINIKNVEAIIQEDL